MSYFKHICPTARTDGQTKGHRTDALSLSLDAAGIEWRSVDFCRWFCIFTTSVLPPASHFGYTPDVRDRQTAGQNCGRHVTEALRIPREQVPRRTPACRCCLLASRFEYTPDGTDRQTDRQTDRYQADALRSPPNSGMLMGHVGRWFCTYNVGSTRRRIDLTVRPL